MTQKAEVKSGYTLLELLAVLAITGLIFGLGYAGFRTYNQRQQTDSAARGIFGDLRLAQEQALAGKKPSGCIVLNGYKFGLSGNHYQVSAACSNAFSSWDVLIKEVSISGNMTVTSPATNPILFKTIGQGTNIPEGDTVTIGLTNTSINYTRSVVVGSGGDLK